MTSRFLERQAVERVWGRTRLPAGFADCAQAGAPVGEIWFRDDRDPSPDLLVKYLFTSERLSIQVHPDDAEAKARGHRCGKDEAWLVTAAEDDAVIGLGLARPLSRAELRAAALNGEIEELVDWKRVKAGDFIYSPAGTIHAIGGGVSLIEIQQNIDLTYRLYDYGRPRELHVEEAVAVADPAPWGGGHAPFEHSAGREILAAGGAFVVERWTLRETASVEAGRPGILLIPLTEGARVDGRRVRPGSVWRVEGESEMEGSGAQVLAAYSGPAVLDSILVRR